MKLFFTQCKVGSTENLNVNYDFLIFGFGVPWKFIIWGSYLKKKIVPLPVGSETFLMFVRLVVGRLFNWMVGPFVSHNFVKGRKVAIPCSYQVITDVHFQNNVNSMCKIYMFLFAEETLWMYTIQRWDRIELNLIPLFLNNWLQFGILIKFRKP